MIFKTYYRRLSFKLLLNSAVCFYFCNYYFKFFSFQSCNNLFIFCSIGGVYRRKAVAKDWFGNSESTSIGGKLEFIQQSEYDITDVEVNLEGLTGKMSGYHIHMVK